MKNTTKFGTHQAETTVNKKLITTRNGGAVSKTLGCDRCATLWQERVVKLFCQKHRFTILVSEVFDCCPQYPEITLRKAYEY